MEADGLLWQPLKEPVERSLCLWLSDFTSPVLRPLLLRFNNSVVVITFFHPYEKLKPSTISLLIDKCLALILKVWLLVLIECCGSHQYQSAAN